MASDGDEGMASASGGAGEFTDSDNEVEYATGGGGQSSSRYRYSSSDISDDDSDASLDSKYYRAMVRRSLGPNAYLADEQVLYDTSEDSGPDKRDDRDAEELSDGDQGHYGGVPSRPDSENEAGALQGYIIASDSDSSDSVPIGVFDELHFANQAVNDAASQSADAASQSALEFDEDDTSILSQDKLEPSESDEFESESEDNEANNRSSAFDPAAHFRSRARFTMTGSKQLSRYQQEAERQAARDADSDADVESGGADADDSSVLSERDVTPSPPQDPQILRIERDLQGVQADFCECQFWCACKRYKIWYGSSIEEQEAAMQKQIEEDEKIKKEEAKTAKDQSSGIDADVDTTSAGEKHEDDDEDDGVMMAPSQTHLPERALAKEVFPESAMRSTLNKGKDEIDEPVVLYTTPSWDLRARPPRPPISWVGPWKQEIDMGNYQPPSVEDAPEED